MVGPKFESRWTDSRAHALHYALVLVIPTQALTVSRHYFFYTAARVTFLEFKYKHVTFPAYNIPPLAHFILDKFDNLFGLQPALISPPFLALQTVGSLLQLFWPAIIVQEQPQTICK